MKSLFLLFLLIATTCSLRVAIIGEGVVGLSTALALNELDPNVEITIFHDRPFEEILSKNIAGLFRIDNGKYRVYGNETFQHLARLWRQFGGFSGVQLVSGHILSDDKEKLIKQKKNYGDIVYNFRFLEDREKFSQFILPKNDNSTVIHYTAYTSEGRKYCPWMKGQLLKLAVQFRERKVSSMDELASDDFPVVINCAGIEGGHVAGDDDSVYPIRGILLHVNASWQKHFLYRDFQTFTIPTIDGVYVGTVKQENNFDSTISDEEVAEIWKRYTTVQPAFNNVEILSHYVGHRPARSSIRVEAQQRQTADGKQYLAVHNYGHGGNGFTLAWGTGLHAASLALGRDVSRFKADESEETS